MLSEGTAWTDVSTMKTATQKLSGRSVTCLYKLGGIVNIYCTLYFNSHVVKSIILRNQ